MSLVIHTIPFQEGTICEKTRLNGQNFKKETNQ